MDDLGARGEEMAERYLKRRGWLPLARNWRAHGSAEIDIIAQRRGVLAIVEVKTRRDSGQLLEPISLRQRRRIAGGAEAFLVRHPELRELELRYDLITVDRSRRPARITHRPDAFGPPPDRRAPSARRPPS